MRVIWNTSPSSGLSISDLAFSYWIREGSGWSDPMLLPLPLIGETWTEFLVSDYDMTQFWLLQAFEE